MTTEDTPAPGHTRSASPPCAMEDVQAYETDAMVALLNELIEGERAGARGLLEMARMPEYAALKDLLNEVAADEARFCSMMSHHVERFGGQPSRATGVFAEKLVRREGLDAKMLLLDKGQSAVVKMLEEMLPRVADEALREDLIEMRDVHVVNIRRCAQES